MQEALYEGNIFHLKTHLESMNDVKVGLAQLKKRGDKGAFLCPYCNEILTPKLGDIREKHFAHRHSKSCKLSVASEVYQVQVKRESKKHSVMKDIIYDELKTQEKIREDLHVGYGFKTKASEGWHFYPDIIVRNKEKELAITILTNVNSSKDKMLVKQIRKRNMYYKSKNLNPIWFIEAAEQSIDMDHRVIHLWEAELDLAIKTVEDQLWEETIDSLTIKDSLFDLFDYHHTELPSILDVCSVYYVHSTETSIKFSVQRFIKDNDRYPFRAFAVNDMYQISLSSALLATQELQLSDPDIEQLQRDDFIQLVKQKESEYQLKQKEKHQNIFKATTSFTFHNELGSEAYEGSDFNQVNGSVENSADNKFVLEDGQLRDAMLEYIRVNDIFSATKLTEHLVSKCGASRDTFSTGRYKVYIDVCQVLATLESEDIIELVEKKFVDDRVYRCK